MVIKAGFVPIAIDAYIDLHVRHNPGTDRTELRSQIDYAIQAQRRGERCSCGGQIWIIGSSQVGLSCFTCITGEAAPDGDYEIDVEQ